MVRDGSLCLMKEGTGGESLEPTFEWGKKKRCDIRWIENCGCLQSNVIFTSRVNWNSVTVKSSLTC